MRRSLFDRVFTYAASAKVLPAENLATEVTAYFLEHWKPLRTRFLRKLGFANDQDWSVTTQHRIYAPKSPDWHGKIPDLLLQSCDGAVMVLVEVKIDAATTYSGDIPQTHLYAKYLEDQIEQRKQVQQTKLALLTRWEPEAALRTPGDVSIRFNDLGHWLMDCIDDGKMSADPMVDLAEQWLNFLKHKRWIMTPITAEHVKAIKWMGELIPQLKEFLQAQANLSDRKKYWRRLFGRRPAEPDYRRVDCSMET